MVTKLEVGDEVYCTGNRGIEYRLPSGEVMTIIGTRQLFGHDYVTVMTAKGPVTNVRAHRFTKVEEAR